LPYTLAVVKAAETQICNEILSDQIDKDYSSVDEAEAGMGIAGANGGA